MIQYDMLIPVAFKDYSFLKRTVKYIEKNLNPDKIFIVTKGATANYIPRCVGRHHLTERVCYNSFFEAERIAE